MRLLSASDLGSKFFVDIKLAPGGESELGPSGFKQPSATAQLGFPDILRRSITVFRYMAKPQAVSEVSGFLLNLYRDSDASRTLGTSRVCLYYSSQSLGCLGSSVHMRSGPAHPHWLAQDEVFSPAARAVLPKPLRITELRQASSGKSRLKREASRLRQSVPSSPIQNGSSKAGTARALAPGTPATADPLASRGGRPVA